MSSPNNSPNRKIALQCESRISLRRSGGTQNDLVNKLEHLRPGFSLGAPVRRYLPAVFGVIDGGTHPRSILRDQTHKTDATEVKNFRQAQPRRQSRGRQQFQIANLPEENIADVSAPSFEMKMPSQRSNMAEAPVASGHTVETVYTEIFDSFADPRDMMTPGTSLQIRDKSLSQKTTHRKVTTHRDSHGNITSRIEETTTVCTAPRDRPPSITRRINFSTEDVSKNVSDETMLMLHDDSRPRTLIGQRYMPSQYPDGQGPLQYRDRSSQREKLEDEPAHSFNGISGATRPWRAPRTIGFLNDQTIPSYMAYTTGFSDRAQQTWPSAYSEQQRRKMRSQGTAPDRTSFPDRSQQDSPSENLESDHRRFRSQSPEGRRSQFQVDLSSATRQRSLSQGSNPRRQQISQQSQNINDNSAPQFNDSPPRGEVSPSSRSPNGNAHPKSVSSEAAPFRNEAGSIKRSNDSVNKGPVPVTDQNLDDVTMPSFGEAATSSHRHVTLPSEDLREVSAREVKIKGSERSPQRLSMPAEQIGDESAPTFASSDHRNTYSQRRSMPSSNINDVSAPTFDSTGRGTAYSQRQSMPSQNIFDESAPTFESTGRGTAYSQRQSFPANTQRKSMPSANIWDESEPTFERTSLGTAHRQRKTLPSGTHRRSMPSQNICHDSCPKFNCSGIEPVPTQWQTMPFQNINDESEPTFEGTGRGTAYRKGSSMSAAAQTRSMPSQNINDESEPTFDSTGRGTAYSQRQSMPSKNIFDESAPIFESTGRGTAYTQRQSAQTRSMPSQNINDESEPKFHSTGRGTAYSQRQSMPSQNINDESKPLLESTGRGTAYSQRQSMPSQNIFDESAPTFESTGRGTAYSQRQSMAAYSQRQSMPSQNINDESEPTFESTGRGASYSQRQSMPSQNINDESEPKFHSTGRGTAYSQRQSMPSQNINDESEPTFGSTARGTSYSQRQSMGVSAKPRSMPSQNINDESEPTFDSTGRGTAYSQRQSMPSQNINDESEPTFGSTARGTSYSQRQSMGVSAKPRSMPSQNINDESEPTFDSTGRGTAYSQRQSMPSQNINDESEPTFGSTARGTSYSQRQSMGVSAKPRSMPSQNINDESKPLFDSTGRGTAYSQRQSMPSKNIIDESAPSFESTGRGTAYTQRQSLPAQTQRKSMTSANIWDESEPTFESSSPGTALRQRKTLPLRTQRQSIPLENICAETCPNFNCSVVEPSTIQWQAMPSQNINDESAPTFESTGRGTGYSQRQSMGPAAQTRSIPSENINEESEPTFDSTGRGTGHSQRQPIAESTQRQSTLSKNLNDESEPIFESTGPETADSQRQTMPSQNINDESAPTFESTGRGTGHSQRQPMAESTQRQSTLSKNLNDESEPIFESTGPETADSERQTMPSHNINDESAPTFESTGPVTEYSQRQSMGPAAQTRSMPSENINNESAPTFEGTGPGTEYSQGKSMPSANIWDESEPNFKSSSPGNALGQRKTLPSSTQRQSKPSDNTCAESCPNVNCSVVEPSTIQWQAMPSQNINDESAPTFESTGPETADSQRQAMPSQNINDVSQPTFESTGETNEKIEMDDERMPEYDEVGGVKRRKISRGQQVSMPSQNIPAPRFMPSGGEVSGAARSTARPEGIMPSRNTFDKPDPSEVRSETTQSFVKVASSSRTPTSVQRGTLLNTAGVRGIERRDLLPPEAANVVMAAYPTGHRGIETYERIEGVSEAAPISICAALIKECMQNLPRQAPPSNISEFIKLENGYHSGGQEVDPRVFQMTNECVANETIQPLPYVSEQPPLGAYQQTEQLGRPVSQRVSYASFSTGILGNVNTLSHPSDTGGNQSCMCDGKREQSLGQTWTDRMDRSTTNKIEDVSMKAFNNLSVTPHHLLQMPKTCLDIATETPLQRRSQSLEYTLSDNDSESDFLTCKSSTDLRQEDKGAIPCGICERVPSDRYFQSMDVGPHDQVVQGVTVTTSMSIISGTRLNQDQRMRAEVQMPNSMTNYDSINQVMQSTGHKSTGTTTQNSYSMEQQNQNQKMRAEVEMLQSRRKNGYSNRSINGFDSMINYVSFDQVMQSTGHQSAGTTTQNNCSMEQQNYQPNQPCPGCPTGASHAMKIQRAWEQGFIICGSRLGTSPITITNYHSTGTTTQNDHSMKKRDFNPTRFAAECDQNSYSSVQACTCQQSQGGGSDFAVELPCGCSPDSESQFDSETECNADGFTARSSSPDEVEAGPHYDDYKAVEECNDNDNDARSPGAYPNPSKAVLNSGANNCNCPLKSEDDSNARPYRPLRGSPGPFFYAVQDTGMWGITSAFLPEPAIAISPCLNGPCSLESERNDDYQSARSSISNEEDRGTYRPPCWVYPSPIRMLFDGLVRLGESL
ncbi:uncharacterized protein LOC108153302 isoform X8 [Drosophila miranda]|uniref:uncharacterized protein LOC108153302 isoform X8 n=1 Tax=Drosophila miranda TaxID=7229 RepID=UPI00143F2A1C|nr:uncharacterized protein LOC108153302 isoform X8 [Drosophila miranda]